MNTRRPFLTYASPGSGQATQGHPAGETRSNGEGGCGSIQPPKDGNPAPFIAPWLIIPLGIAAWGMVGLGASFLLHWAGF